MDKPFTMKHDIGQMLHKIQFKEITCFACEKELHLVHDISRYIGNNDL